MRRFEVVADHVVWDVLHGDRVVGLHQRRPDAVWQAAARANAPGRLAVTADGR